MERARVISIMAIIALSMALLAAAIGYADDSAAEKSKDSVFQKLGDMINGKYEVKTEPFKKIGIFQAMANSIGVVTRGQN